MTYKRYDEYKDTNVKWLGKIPDHWSISKLKYLSDIGTGNKDTINKEENGDYPFFVRSQTVEKISTYAYDGEAVLTAGDGVGVGKVFHYINGKFDFHQRVYKISDFKKVKAKFFYYYIKENFIKETEVNNTKSTVDSIRLPMIQQFPVVIPSTYEQDKIIKFLDKKSFEIDELIEKKEILIELLKEKRESIITEAVTKGLDKNVKMKDSGVEWIGEIPEHWNAKKLRYLGELQNGISKSAQYFGKGFPFVSYSDVYKNEEIPNEVNGKVESTTSERELYSVKEDDVFFTRTSETIEEIGFASTCFSSIEDSTFAGFLIRFRPNEKMLYKGFSKYYFRSNIHRRFFVKEMNIVTRASLSQELLKQLPVLIPPINEQKKIYNFLNRKISDIDKLIIDIGVQINNLNEYKKSLISEIVTGKIDVRNEV